MISAAPKVLVPPALATCTFLASLPLLSLGMPLLLQESMSSRAEMIQSRLHTQPSKALEHGAYLPTSPLLQLGRSLPLHTTTLL